MPTKLHTEFPGVVGDYPLDQLGWFSVVMPKEATNLIANPSFETDTNLWTVVSSATLAKVATYQRRGAYSLSITPNSASGSGTYYALSLTANLLYSFSLDLYGVPGVQYQITLADTSAVAQTTFKQLTVYGKGRWERLTIKGTVGSTATYRLYIQKLGSSVAPFYVDGVQGELGEPSTYFDGDSRGFVVGQNAFYWVGTPHASVSFRSGQTRAGGTLVKLSDLGFVLLTIVGLGHAPLSNIASPLGYLDGALYQNTRREPLTFTLIGALSGSNLRELHRARSGLIQAFDPELIGIKQPLILQYQYGDDCDELSGETLNITCNYQSGLEGNLSNFYQERIPLQFQMFLPWIAGDGSQAETLDSVTQASGDFAARRGTDGLWSALATFGGVNKSVHKIAIDKAHGRVYFGGAFTLINTILTVNGIAYLDLVDNTFHAMGSGTVGVANGQVEDIVIDANGDVWIGGGFDTVGGSATTGLARYNRVANTWTAFPITTTTFTSIYALAIDFQGNLFGGGNFTNWNSNANSDYIWIYDGTNFAPLADDAGNLPLNGPVNDIVVATNGITYVGGNFSAAGALSVENIAYWLRSTSPTTGAATYAWTRMWSGVGQTLNGEVTGLSFDPLRFTLHVIGAFTQVANNTVPYAQYYAVFIWNQMWRAGTLPKVMTQQPTEVHWVEPEGAYLGFGAGATGQDQAILVPNSTAPPIHLFSNKTTLAVITTIAGPDASGRVYMGSSGYAITVDVEGLTTITNSGTVRAYPTLRLVGPGTLVWLKNSTTGATLYFDDYLMQTGETIILVTEPTRQSMTSSINGNIYWAILRGSDTDRFFLQPGDNLISLFVTADATTESILSWIPRYAGIDGAH